MLLIIAPVYGLLFSFHDHGEPLVPSARPAVDADGHRRRSVFLEPDDLLYGGWQRNRRQNRGYGGIWHIGLGLISIIAGVVLVPLTAWLLPSVHAEPDEDGGR